MRPAVMACDRCGAEVRGRFASTRFHYLSPDDLAFLKRYLLAGSSIKAVA